MQRPDSNPDLLHSHGHNGQNFQYEKQSEIVRDSQGHNGQDFQCKNVSRRQKHSHGHNGQDFQCEKQSEILRVSHGHNGQDFQQKMSVEGRNTAMVTMVRISNVKTFSDSESQSWS